VEESESAAGLHKPSVAHEESDIDIEPLMRHADRKDKFWGGAAALLAHLLLPVSLVTMLQRRSSTPLVAAWVFFCTGLREGKLTEVSSSVTRGALSTALGLVVACLCTDVLWLVEFADASYFRSAADEVTLAVKAVSKARSFEAIGGLDVLQVSVVLCTLLAGALEVLLVPLLLKAYSSVRFPPRQQLAWQKQAEAEWQMRCITVLTINFGIGFATSVVSMANGEWHATASLVLPILSCWAVSRAKSPSSPILICCVLMLLGPLADVGWLFLGQGVSVHQFVLMLNGHMEFVNSLGLTRRAILVGAAGSALTTLVAVIFMLILKATMVPRVASGRKSCATAALKALTTALIVLGICSSFESFAPSLVVAAVGLIAASALGDASTNELRDHTLLFVFRFGGFACLFAQALWMMWYGKGPHLLNVAEAVAEDKGAVFVQEETSLVSQFAVEMAAELGSGEASHVDEPAVVAGFSELLHESLTLLSFLVLSSALCLTAALQARLERVEFASGSALYTAMV